MGGAHTKTQYRGEFDLPQPLAHLLKYGDEMCPSGLALHHPEANLLKEWATYECPTHTGWPCMKEQMQEVIDCDPHQFALLEGAIMHFQVEVKEKVRICQAKVIA
jgi:hypothetical protein